MCGIFGFVSTNPKNPTEILRGLKILEYRGYDSWGIAMKTKKSKLIVQKDTGKIGNSKLNSQFSNLNSQLGIGHTRWATHGNVTVENAHPHLDCTKTLAVVHNGIIENFEELKRELIKKGHKFLSQTDTEVFIHLVEENLKSTGFATAVRNAFNSIKGLNAVVVINSVSKEIIACKNGSPLIVGVSKDGYFIASDVSALLKHTNKIIVLKDNQMVILGDKLKLLELPSGNAVAPNIETSKSNVQNQTKGKFKHFLLKEIYDQPEILLNIPKLSKKDINRLATSIDKAFGTFMLGCGSASYAALAGEYFFSKIAKRHINFSVGSEFEYIQDFITRKSLIIPISQSGETIDVIEPVRNAKQKGATIVSVVNSENSTLARMSEFSVFLNAGSEKAVVGTKSFTTMVGILLLTAFSLAEKEEIGIKLLKKAYLDTKNIISKNSINDIKKLARKLKGKEHVFTIGRGISYVTAIEAALKLKETALIHAEGFAGGELKHGVIALIEKGTPCIVFAPNDETYNDIVSNAQEIKARGGYIIGIGPRKNSVFDEFLKTGDIAEATIISQVVYMQLLAYYLALERKIEDPDKPRNLAKSVTVK